MIVTITLIFFLFNVTYFSTKFKKTYIFDYNDVNFNARLSLFMIDILAQVIASINIKEPSKPETVPTQIPKTLRKY